MGIREFKREFVGDCGRDFGRVRVAIGNGNVFSVRHDGDSVFYNLFRVKIEHRMEMLSVALPKNPKRRSQMPGKNVGNFTKASLSQTTLSRLTTANDHEKPA